ncbi:hypothetical protein CUMW_260790 [Citrus unshiu]|uniref:Uncharacterized protein n=1 Tax=Citrus unshiu TaxID=55188 RepID=A0A2H5QTQ8_CITUN|nr:hypothetical protein CUMW_260790 [Citrus unshiu]
MRTSGLLHGQPASTRYGIKWLKMSDFHFASIGCATQHLKSVVLALGGSRRLHFLYLHQLLMLPPDALPSFSKRNPLPCVIGLKTPAYWWLKMSAFHITSIRCATQQLRSVVLALGGSRRLHSLYLYQLPMLSPDTPPSFSKWNPLPCVMGPKTRAYYWRDKVHLSVSAFHSLL